MELNNIESIKNLTSLPQSEELETAIKTFKKMGSNYTAEEFVFQNKDD
jgi:hypothetical protein